MGVRRKTYVAGSRDDLRVPFCEVVLDPPNEPVRLYDTSGSGGDPRAGLDPHRAAWIHDRGDVEHYTGRVATLRDDGRASYRAGRSGAEPFPGAGELVATLLAALGRMSRGELLSRMFSGEMLEAFREFKSIWDPDWKMNPGKVVDPYPVDANLRLGTDYRPAQPDTHFAFPEDDGSFSRAALRCVGVGKCRKDGAGTMCPSYMVTHEEEHSTRGRARLLFEMLEGDVVKDGWRSDDVKEALDLCLACKACKNECPVNVDMATYKSEFFSHYYAGRLRPIQAYSVGLIYWWARIAGHMPRVVNAVTQAPALAAVIKRLGGVAPQRPIPTFSAPPFTTWFRARGERGVGAPDVLLWPDTFNNYLDADHAKAAVEVLEAARAVDAAPRS